jgi:Protein of unknown function (DUF2934)
LVLALLAVLGTTESQEQAMSRKTKVLSTSDIGSQELTEEIIRIRAYHLFEQRGFRHGSDLEDWLQAEAEVLGKKPGASVSETERAQDAAAAS